MRRHVFQLWRKMSQKEYSSIYQQKGFCCFIPELVCRRSLLHWSVPESVWISNDPLKQHFDVPAWVRMMQICPLQLKQGRSVEEGRSVASARSLLPSLVGTASSTLMWWFLFGLQWRSLSNQYQNENISSFHTECCITCRDSLGESRMHFVMLCLYFNVMYYYSNLSIALTKEEGALHTNLITFFCRENCLLFY